MGVAINGGVNMNASASWHYRRMFLKKASVFLPAFLFSFISLQAAPTPEQVAEMVRGNDIKALTGQSLTFIQITDSHMVNTDKDYKVSPDLTRRVLAEAKKIYPKSAFAVFTGDISNMGGLAVFEQAVANAEMKVYAVPGNADRCPPLHFTGKPMDWVIIAEPAGRKEYPVPWRIPWRDDRSTLEIGNSLFIFADFALPMIHEGALLGDQLRWIHETLSASSDKHVFIFVHHGDLQLLNQDRLDNMLAWHRSRFRSIMVVAGHTHRRGRMPVPKQAVQYIETGTLKDGVYRVFHVFDDYVITYERNSTAYAQMAADAGKTAESGAAAAAFNPLSSKPAVIADGTRAPATPVDPMGYLGMKSDLMDSKSDKPPKSGDVLSLDFGAVEPAWIFHDSSGCGNHVFCNYPIFKKSSAEGLLIKYEGRRGLLFSGFAGYKGEIIKAGVWELTGFDSVSLNSPHLTNRVTVEADVYVPVQPVGGDYGIVGKGAYDLGLEPDGRARFSLWLSEGGKRRQVVLNTAAPLPAGRWQKLKGGFDGKTVRLQLNGEPAAEEAAGADARIMVSHGPIVIGFNRAPPKDLGKRMGFVIGRIKVANLP
ncbi:MAG: LamG-like jellyroll fold domain-containing protein, partial [Kiritimatiellota bacterium]|nr:LamG-like jellyroll fold domain-containing protein [Kiritimatiellota bacterium]